MGSPRVARVQASPLGAVDAYLLAVTLAGCALLGVVGVDSASEFLPTAPAEFWVFAGLAVLGQMLTIKVRGYDEITSSTAFVYAILLLFGTTAAVLAQTASTLADERARPQAGAADELRARAADDLHRGRRRAAVGA